MNTPCKPSAPSHRRSANHRGEVGSSSLTKPSGHLDPERLNALVAAIARVRLMGGRVVLVSSGAIAAGFGSLGFDARPTDVADQQACAAVGQGLLMAQYENAFAHYGLRVGQILITVSDTIAPQQYRNVRRTLERLLDLARCQSSTKTTRSHPTKSDSETTTASPH